MLINVLSVEKNLPKGVAKGINLTSVFRVYSQEKNNVWCHYNLVWYDMMPHIQTALQWRKQNKRKTEFEKKNNPYFALRGEMWDINY